MTYLVYVRIHEMTYLGTNDEITGREITVLDYLDKFPDYNHNSLMKEICPKEMAKKTFEKCIKSLIQKGIIKPYKIKNRLIYVRVNEVKENYDSNLEKMTTVLFKFLDHEIKRIKRDYKGYSVEDKVFNISYQLNNILKTDIGFTLLDSMKDYHETLYADEHQSIQEYIGQLFAIVKNDKDFLTVYPLVMNNVGVFPQTTTQEMKDSLSQNS